MEWYKDGLYPEWHIDGKDFSPKKLKETFPDLILSSNHEVGEFGEFKWNKNEKYDYGSCIIVVEDSIQFKLDWLLNFILENGDEIRKLGVDNELIWLIWYGIQGNMELDSRMIRKLAKTGLSMNMNYHYIEQ